jgi:hypothetical protein
MLIEKESSVHRLDTDHLLLTFTEVTRDKVESVSVKEMLIQNLIGRKGLCGGNLSYNKFS